MDQTRIIAENTLLNMITPGYAVSPWKSVESRFSAEAVIEQVADNRWRPFTTKDDGRTPPATVFFWKISLYESAADRPST